MYTVTVKTDGTKTVQSKSYNDLLSSRLHLITDFVLTQRKLAHGPVKFPARSISHFAMNIIMAKTGSTAKVNSAKWHIFSNPPKYLPAKISEARIDSDHWPRFARSRSPLGNYLFLNFNNCRR